MADLRALLSRAGMMALVLLAPLCNASLAAEPSAAVREVKLTFAQLGNPGAMELHGLQSVGSVNLGTRLDEVVVGAKLHLRFTYSPALLPELSHLRVSLNGQVLAALPLPKEQAGREIEREVVLDPRYFSDYNQIRFDLIGHYTLECEDAQHSSLWATINPASDLDLTTRPLELRADLAALPTPFFDVHDNGRLVLPIVLPSNPPRGVVRAAGVAASWFGMLADYRSARFPVSFDSLPERHSLVFATNQARPQGLELADVQAPTVKVLDHPANPNVKLLVLQGKDEAQLKDAVDGLVLGQPVLSGTSATITKVQYERRRAYDAPHWLTTTRPIKLGELVDSPQQLQASGIAPAPIRVSLRLPPDLFTWNTSGVPVDLRYRYTAPSERDNSLLTVSVNDQMLRSYRLRSESESGSGGKLLVPLLQSATAPQSEGLLIPAFQLASNNQMQFQFAMDYHRDGLCKQIATDGLREAIDPDSTIDISGFPHYTAMPNLALFANASYPFTRYADLAETAIVLPDTNREALEQLFFVLGRMGRHTGAVAVAYRLIDLQEAEHASGADLLVLSGEGSNRLLAKWGKNVSLVLDESARHFRDPNFAPRFDSDALREARVEIPAADVSVSATGSLGALVSFESPLSANRTVVALAASDSQAASSLMDVLENEGKVPFIRGDLAIVRGDSVQSYQGDAVYYIGSLSWWKKLWFHLSRHFVLLTVAALAGAVAVAMLIYGWLQRRVNRRLESTGAH